jgi:hypothetical protein
MKGSADGVTQEFPKSGSGTISLFVLGRALQPFSRKYSTDPLIAKHRFPSQHVKKRRLVSRLQACRTT